MPTTEGKQLLGMFLHDECWLHGVLNREVNTYTQSPFRPFFFMGMGIRFTSFKCRTTTRRVSFSLQHKLC